MSGRKRRLPRVSPSSSTASDTSDDAIALFFAERNEGYLCYVDAWSCWMKCDGQRWKRDGKVTARETIRRICRELAQSETEPHKTERLASIKKIKAVEELARSDQRLCRDDSSWDRDPWLLNTPGGVVDLKSGNISCHDPELCMTRMTKASPSDEAPRWRNFLHKISGGDKELGDFLQRVAGYCLTGSVREHAFFFLWGTGANGKSVFTTVLMDILGDYATAAALGTFTASNYQQHPTELAILRGARLVVASEIERGARIAESRLKLMTGGDRLMARHMRQDFWNFEPTFKIMMTGNQLPNLGGVDEAIRRRIHIVPFTVTIAANERNPHLVEELLVESDGILLWAVEGCLKWQSIGLAPPACVRDLTANHLDELDPVGRFLSAYCEIAPGFSCGSSDIFEVWKEWAREQGEPQNSQKAFVQELLLRGFNRRQSARKRLICGLQLRTSLRDKNGGSK